MVAPWCYRQSGRLRGLREKRFRDLQLLNFGSQHDDPPARVGRAESFQCLHAAQPWHADIKKQNVELDPEGSFDGFPAVGGFADDDKLCVYFKKAAQPIPENRVAAAMRMPIAWRYCSKNARPESLLLVWKVRWFEWCSHQPVRFDCERTNAARIVWAAASVRRQPTA